MSSAPVDIKNFKKAVKVLQKKVEKNYFPNNEWTCGICHMLYEETEDAYELMERLLTYDEYHYGLGLVNGLTEDRKVFLEFLAYTLSEEDIQKICNQ